MLGKFGVMAILIALLSVVSWAQEEPPKFDGGLVFSRISAQPSGDMGGVGLRAGYFVRPFIALEGEVLHDPGLGDGPHGETTLLFGARLGKRWDNFGIFAKVRPGLIHCGDTSCLGRFTNHPDFFAVDLGGVFEYYPSRHGYIRMDIGDTAVSYGGATATGYPGPALGWQHHPTVAIGFGVRF